MKTLSEQAATLNKVVPFGLTVITKYTNGKITAKLAHGIDLKTTVRVSYDHGLNSNENHIVAALTLIEKVKKEHNKSFEIVYSSYNEKDDGYAYILNRLIEGV